MRQDYRMRDKLWGVGDQLNAIRLRIIRGIKIRGQGEEMMGRIDQEEGKMCHLQA